MSISFVGNHRKLSDDELVSLINDGVSEYLPILISRYMPLVRKYAHRFSKNESDIDDLAQDALIAFCSAVARYKKGQVPFSSFAAICIKRALIGQHRAALRKKNIPSELLSSLDETSELADTDDPEAILIQKENLKKLADTIRLELSSLEYRVLSAFLSGKSYAQISEYLGISPKSVDNALRRIRGKLKNS